MFADIFQYFFKQTSLSIDEKWRIVNGKCANCSFNSKYNDNFI